MPDDTRTHLLISDPDLILQAAAKKNLTVDLPGILQLQQQLEQRHHVQVATRGVHNTARQELGQAQGPRRAELAAQLHDLNKQLTTINTQISTLNEQLHAAWRTIPASPHSDAPSGSPTELRRSGDTTAPAFTPLSGAQLLDRHHWTHNQAGRPALLKNQMVKFELALHLLVTELLEQRGMTPLNVPALIRPEQQEGTYHLREDQLQLSSGPVNALLALHSGHVIPWGNLPLAYAGHSAGYRPLPDGPAHPLTGQEYRRTDQVIITLQDPSASLAWLEELTWNTEAILTALELPYRIQRLNTEQMNTDEVLTYTADVWSVHQQAYVTMSRMAYHGPWHAMRQNIQHHDPHLQLRWADTISATGLPSPELIGLLLEQHQQADRTVNVPHALRSYLGGRASLGRP